MKQFKWMIFMMLAVCVLLAACNQTEEQEEPVDENQAEEENNTEDEQIITIAETFISQLAEGNYEEATENFDETMSAQLTATELEEIWSSLTEQVGDFIAQEYNTTEEVDEGQVVLITGVFNEADVTFQITVDPDQQIAGFYVQ